MFRWELNGTLIIVSFDNLSSEKNELRTSWELHHNVRARVRGHGPQTEPMNSRVRRSDSSDNGLDTIQRLPRETALSKPDMQNKRLNQDGLRNVEMHVNFIFIL